MTDEKRLKPDTEHQLVDTVKWAGAEETPLEVMGAGTKRGLGRPVQAAYSLDLTGLTGITLHEPEELVLSAKAGTPVAEIEATLAERKQMLAFEPADLGPLYGHPAGQHTIGGVIGGNLSGPRRFKAGAGRDHFLGFSGVSGRGEAFKAGSRVMKNVTGYDLSKAICGAYGTLVALSEVTVKVLPAPETTATVLVLGLDEGTALHAMAEALKSPHEVSGATFLPHALAIRSQAESLESTETSVVALRIEGFGPSVAVRTDAIADMMGRYGPVRRLETEESMVLWRDVRDVAPYLGTGDRAIWRLSVAPMAAANVITRIEGARALDAYFDWGGGLIWLATDSGGDAGAAAVRAAIDGRGHATLMRAPEGVRAATPVFQPQDPALAGLTARIKDAYDPRHVLNPGRMVAGL